jgi:glycosyltransferase involved in cell wall biosynthesis
MHIVHLMASPFYGGPERQMLGLARHLPKEDRTTFLSFPERGLCKPFLDEVQRYGFEGRALRHNIPNLRASIREIADELRRLKADIVCCSGYKPDVLGWRAARRVGLPVVAVAHGWTAATARVRFYEWLDRTVMRRMDAVVGVSAAQAEKVRQAGVPDDKIVVVHNAVGGEAFAAPDPAYRDKLLALFPTPPRWVVGSAGRLSPEKNFALLIDAAAAVVKDNPDIGFVVFGEGPLRPALVEQIVRLGLRERFVLAGFRNDLSSWLPHLDLAVMSSTTEGLPVFLLEAFAAAVPMVATAVGGIPEVLQDGRSGYLIPSGDGAALARRISELLGAEAARQRMGRAAKERVQTAFSFEEMARKYRELFARLVRER